MIRLSKTSLQSQESETIQKKNYMLCNSNAQPFKQLQSVTATEIVEASASEKRNKSYKTQPRENTLKRNYLEE